MTFYLENGEWRKSVWALTDRKPLTRGLNLVQFDGVNVPVIITGNTIKVDPGGVLEGNKARVEIPPLSPSGDSVYLFDFPTLGPVEINPNDGDAILQIEAADYEHRAIVVFEDD